MTRRFAPHRLLDLLDQRARTWHRFAALGLSVALLLSWATDLRNVVRSREIVDWMGPPHSPMDFAPAIAGAVCVLVVWLVVRPRVGRTATVAAGIVVPIAVIVTSALLWPVPKGVFGFPISMTEALGMLTVLALTALRGRAWQILLVSVLAALAAFSDHLREPFSMTAGTPLLLVLVGLAPGLYLRWRAADREARLRRVRAEERLSIARDLHDVVAHEVTGIVVRVQALRHVADRRPELVGEALPEIEEAGTRALESMRGMVSRLRGPEEAPLVSDPVEGLRTLAAPAGHGRPEVSVSVTGAVADLSAAVGTAVWRIAQESVTNALRHARGATGVDVEVWTTADEARLRVTDDGRGGSRGGPGGGHGLLGMEERARILGGTVAAGPSGRGWTVTAMIPMTERGRGDD
ncbi:sensor histidine kinase [Nocardiopsis sp. MG754419]|uniref:sensor histidine kinase n=1 Tax=Nocardiopsis sp. MG754419 TaxID=2259865 RepID=UPI001BA9D9AD|nr:histidine kinase [Nocardiopsis sp. MG754419]MBR8743555.1 sensor histidine kinase [Nocardiopsis sp. MG754419]